MEYKKVSTYSEKKIRKRSSINVENNKITEYFGNQTKLDRVLEENKYLSEKIRELESKQKSSRELVANVKLDSNLLSELLKIATSESKKKVFSTNMKYYSVYIYLIGGNLLYSSISKELGLPSLSTTKATLSKMKSCEIYEGVPRFTGLKDYLIDNGYPLLVFGSEDQTKIKESLKYDSKSNRIIGFALPLENNGLPNPDGVEFHSINQLQDIIERLPKATYVNTIMIQPIQLNAIPYVFCVYGTKNSFTKENVTQRWNFIKDGLSLVGIRLIGE